MRGGQEVKTSLAPESMGTAGEVQTDLYSHYSAVRPEKHC